MSSTLQPIQKVCQAIVVTAMLHNFARHLPLEDEDEQMLAELMHEQPDGNEWPDNDDQNHAGIARRNQILELLRE